jgi:hypothetical protein
MKTLSKHLKILEITLANLKENSQENNDNHINLINDLKSLINKHQPHFKSTRQPQKHKMIFKISKLLILLFIITNLYPYDAFLLSLSIILHLFVKSQKKWYFSYLSQCKQNKLHQFNLERKTKWISYQKF